MFGVSWEMGGASTADRVQDGGLGRVVRAGAAEIGIGVMDGVWVILIGQRRL